MRYLILTAIITFIGILIAPSVQEGYDKVKARIKARYDKYQKDKYEETKDE